MTKLGFYFNMQHCTGCRTCQVTCKEKNGLPIGPLFRHVRTFEVGEFPNPGYFHYSSSCNHCESPACVAECPTGAMYVDETDGTVQHNDGECIGCETCVKACPYEVPQYRDDLGIVQKCNFCHDLPEGEEPVCVSSCPQFALEYGDIEELRQKHPDAVSDLPFLPDSSQTSPAFIVTPKEVAKETGFTEKRL